ncbi:MAG TPA: acyl-CoA dehydrogenase family protein, partial [Egibacteraceae bacterium]|nr:acyl-CoA dehydrogenase family protein [Egibacteraceae bacterium]
MSIAISEEQLALRDSVTRWAAQRQVAATAREALEAPGDGLPATWPELAAQGWLSVHVPVEHGGGGAGVAELAVVLEALAQAGAPGPVLPTALASALVAAADCGDGPALLSRLVAGEAAAVAWGEGTVQARVAVQPPAGALGAGLVLGAGTAALLVVGAEVEGRTAWFAVDAGGFTAQAPGSLDGAHRVARVALAASVPATRLLAHVDDALVRELAVTLAAAQAAGIAAWCQEAATEYAKVREQFGRPIGSFQAVKHACANLLAKVEMARAAAWDAAHAAADGAQRPLAAAAAGAVALDAAVDCAKTCIQLHGGIGYTWEHDAHLYLRHALVLRQLLGPTSRYRAEAARGALAGARRSLSLELPAEAEALREGVRAFLAELEGLDADAQRRHIARHGYVQPHWPAPWGRWASASSPSS